jgi:hypothetical protein
VDESAQRTMRPRLGVVAAVEAEHVLEVAAPQDEDSVEAVGAMVRTQRSAKAFRFGRAIPPPELRSRRPSRPRRAATRSVS